MKKYVRNKIEMLIVIAILITISVNFNINMKKTANYIEPQQVGKNVVNIWLKASQITTIIRYQVNNFNDDNKDNIYINLNVYDKDYDNLLTTAMASGKGPDIFQYTNYDIVKNNYALDLRKLHIDDKIIGKEDYIYYNDIPIGSKFTDNKAMLIINKNIFDKNNIKISKISTWQDVLNICERLKERNLKITPFGFRYNSFEAFETSFGVPSQGSNNIYSTFYNYKLGKYDYNQMKNILNTYAYMYKQGYIAKDFEKITEDKLRYDFYSGNVAFIIGSFEDKSFFSTSIALPFDIEIFDVPSATGTSTEKFNISQNNFVCVNSSVLTTDKMYAVNKVYSWFFNKSNLKQLSGTKQVIASVLNGNIGKDENKDPTPFIPLDSTNITKLIEDSIKNKENINQNLTKIVKITDDNFKLRVQENNINIDEYIIKN